MGSFLSLVGLGRGYSQRVYEEVKRVLPDLGGAPQESLMVKGASRYPCSVLEGQRLKVLGRKSFSLMYMMVKR